VENKLIERVLLVCLVVEGFEKNLDDWVQAVREELDKEKQDGVVTGARG